MARRCPRGCRSQRTATHATSGECPPGGTHPRSLRSRATTPRSGRPARGCTRAPRRVQRPADQHRGPRPRSLRRRDHDGGCGVTERLETSAKWDRPRGRASSGGRRRHPRRPSMAVARGTWTRPSCSGVDGRTSSNQESSGMVVATVAGRANGRVGPKVTRARTPRSRSSAIDTLKTMPEDSCERPINKRLCATFESHARRGSR